MNHDLAFAQTDLTNMYLEFNSISRIVNKNHQKRKRVDGGMEHSSHYLKMTRYLVTNLGVFEGATRIVDHKPTKSPAGHYPSL